MEENIQNLFIVLFIIFLLGAIPLLVLLLMKGG
jgi:hypothetical protein